MAASRAALTTTARSLPPRSRRALNTDESRALCPPDEDFNGDALLLTLGITPAAAPPQPAAAATPDLDLGFGRVGEDDDLPSLDGLFDGGDFALPLPTPAPQVQCVPVPVQHQHQHQQVDGIPATFTTGRTTRARPNGTVRRTADYPGYIEAIRAVLQPCEGSALLLTTDSLTRTPGILDALSAFAGRTLQNGIVNGLLVGVFGCQSSQQNFCPRPDLHGGGRVICTRGNCAGHYDHVVRHRNRFTVVEGVAYR